MIVNKDELNRLKYLEREIDNPHFKKVITSIIHNIQVNNFVYVIEESGSWDYETTGHTEVYSTFKEALASYKNLVSTAKEDMKEWIDEDETTIDEQIDEEAESAEFEIYQDGDFTRYHDTVSIKKKEVDADA